MTIHCPHCNFEIILSGVRPGRFSPACQNCQQTFTLYIPPDGFPAFMVARSHLELHERCLLEGVTPPQPYPAGVEVAPATQPAALLRADAWLGEADLISAEPQVLDMEPAPAPTAPTTKAQRPSDTPTVDELPRESRVRIRRKGWLRRRFGSPPDILLGPPIRLTLAVVLLSAFGIWFSQYRARTSVQAVQNVLVGVPKTDSRRAPATNDATTKPQPADTPVLEIPVISLPLRKALSGWNAGVAGAILAATGWLRGRWLGLTMLLAAAIALMGHWVVIPNFGQPQPWMSASAAGAIALLASFFLRGPGD